MSSLFLGFLIGLLPVVIAGGFLYYYFTNNELIRPSLPEKRSSDSFYCLWPSSFIASIKSGELDALALEEAQQKIIDEKYEKDKKEYKRELKEYHRAVTIRIIITISLIIVLFSLFCVGSTLLISHNFSKDAEAELLEFNAKKTTIEQSLQNPEISGLERIELVKMVSELNSWLVNRKFSYQRWYNFDIHKSVKEKYFNTEPISLN